MNRVRSAQSRSDAGTKHSGGVVTTFVSGKGGVGKTNLALNVAIQFARRGLNTILLDADFGLCNTDILLNLAPLGDAEDLLRNRRQLGELLAEGPAGLRVLCGSAGSHADGHSMTECRQLVRRLRPHCEQLVVDCGSSISASLMAAALESDQLVLTTTPEPTALADGYATLKYVSQRGFAAGCGCVVNMARSRDEATGVVRRLQRVAAEFLGLSIDDLGHVPWDRHVPQAVRARQPVLLRSPTCAASLAIEEVCRKLSPAASNGAATGGMWSRLATIFL